MSVRAFFNSVKEGFRGIVRHPLVTIASITTILLMLFIMGVFFIFSVNVRTIMTRLSQRPPIEVYMKLQCTEEELNDVGIYQNTIRLSIGTEHIDDIIADLEKGFAAI